MNFGCSAVDFMRFDVTLIFIVEIDRIYLLKRYEYLVF